MSNNVSYILYIFRYNKRHGQRFLYLQCTVHYVLKVAQFTEENNYLNIFQIQCSYKNKYLAKLYTLLLNLEQVLIDYKNAKVSYAIVYRLYIEGKKITPKYYIHHSSKSTLEDPLSQVQSHFLRKNQELHNGAVTNMTVHVLPGNKFIELRTDI